MYIQVAKIQEWREKPGSQSQVKVKARLEVHEGGDVLLCFYELLLVPRNERKCWSTPAALINALLDSQEGKNLDERLSTHTAEEKWSRIRIKINLLVIHEL